jgi:pilus assembly protein CpaE
MESLDRHLASLVRSSGLALAATVPVGDFAALDRPQSRPPDVLLMDLRGQVGLPPELATFKRRHKGTGVVIIASQLDPGLMLEAMRAGVTEWVTDPLSMPELKAAIERVVGQHTPTEAPGQVFAFMGTKGGVGATTVAVNVAAAMASEPDSQVIMADLHIANYGDAALLFGAEPRFSVVDAIENSHRLDEAFLDTLVVRAKPGIDLLASPERPSSSHADALQIRGLIEVLAKNYKAVILDVPHSDMSLLDAFEPATAIVLVVNQELPTVRRATKIAGLLRQRYGKERLSLVVTRYDARAEIGQDDIERVVGLPVWAMLPSDYRLAISAANVGRPLVIDNKTRLPMVLRQLAQQLRGVHPHNAPPETKETKRVGARRLGLAGLF